jgi:multiple sugar transport system permease protein
MKKRNRKRKVNWTAICFVAPNLIGFLVFIVLPVLFSLIVSFTDFNIFKGLDGMAFVGLDNFKEMFKDNWFKAALKNNLLYTVVTIPILIGLSMIVATLLNNKVYFKKTLRALIFVPYISSIVAIAAVWRLIYNPSQGMLNQVLRAIGIVNPPGWIGSLTWALPAIMIVGIWMGLGYNVIVYMAGLQSIDASLYESAQIDGANPIQTFHRVTVPMLRNTTFFLLITNIIGSFQVFGIVNIMTGGGPGTSTTVIAQYIYLTGFRYHKMGYAAAMAWVLLGAIFMVTLFQWRIQRRSEELM